VVVVEKAKGERGVVVVDPVGMTKEGVDVDVEDVEVGVVAMKRGTGSL
jgi:hypothetical protein